MERIQLKDAGAELVMTVASVKPEVVERNNYYLFGNGAKEMLVPQSSVESQIERLGVKSATDLVGKTVKFGRSTKMSRANKPYWNLDLATDDEMKAAGLNGSGGTSATQASAGGSVGASAGATSPPRSHHGEIYAQSTDFIITRVIPKYKAAGFAVDS